MWRKRVPSTGISDASFVLPYSKGASSKLQGGELEALGPRQAAKEMRVWAGLTLMVNMHLASAGRPFRKEVFFNFVEMMPPSLIDPAVLGHVDKTHLSGGCLHHLLVPGAAPDTTRESFLKHQPLPS